MLFVELELNEGENVMRDIILALDRLAIKRCCLAVSAKIARRGC